MQSGATRKFTTTPGTRDILPPESTRLLDVQARILGRFRLHGFREVITPALEYSEVVEEPKLRDASLQALRSGQPDAPAAPRDDNPDRASRGPAPAQQPQHRTSSPTAYRSTGEPALATARARSSTRPASRSSARRARRRRRDHRSTRGDASEPGSLAPRGTSSWCSDRRAFYEGYLRRVAPEARLRTTRGARRQGPRAGGRDLTGHP